MWDTYLRFMTTLVTTKSMMIVNSSIRFMMDILYHLVQVASQVLAHLALVVPVVMDIPQVPVVQLAYLV